MSLQLTTADDRANLTGTGTALLPVAPANLFEFTVANVGSGSITVSPGAGATITGGSKTILGGGSIRFRYATSGTNWSVVDTLAVAVGTSNAAQSSVGGSTSGTAVFSQPEQGASYKLVVIYCAALLGTAAYTYPVAFSHAPDITGSLAGIAVATTTAVTLTGVTSTGYIVLTGF